MNPVYQGDATASTPALTSDTIARELLSVKWTLRPLYKYILNNYAKTGGCFLDPAHFCKILRQWGAASSLSTLWANLRILEALGKIEVAFRDHEPTLIRLLSRTDPARNCDGIRRESASRGVREESSTPNPLPQSHKQAGPRKRVAALTPPVDVQEPKGSFEEDSPITQIEPHAAPVLDTPDEDTAAIRAELDAALSDVEASPFAADTESAETLTSVADDVEEMQTASVCAENARTQQAVTADTRQTTNPSMDPRRRSQEPPETPGDHADLLRRLEALGVTPTTAARMVSDDPDEVARQLAASGLKTASNPAAWIVSAVQRRYRPSARRERAPAYVGPPGHVGIEGRARVVTAPRQWRERFENSS